MTAPSQGNQSTPPDQVGALSHLVQAEAHRVLSQAQIAPDPARAAGGWERRFVADAERAAEAVRLYEELGYEVCADPLRPDDLTGECEDCRLLMLLQFKTIYTRSVQRRS